MHASGFVPTVCLGPGRILKLTPGSPSASGSITLRVREGQAQRLHARASHKRVRTVATAGADDALCAADGMTKGVKILVS